MTLDEFIKTANLIDKESTYGCMPTMSLTYEVSENEM